MRIISLGLVILWLGGAAALSGGCNSSSEPTPLVLTNNVTNLTTTATGKWSGTFTVTGVPFSMTLVQNGTALTGAYAAQGYPGDVSGQITGSTIELTVTAHTGGGDVVAQWDGTLTPDLASAAGTYNILSGGGGNGSWQMNR